MTNTALLFHSVIFRTQPQAKSVCLRPVSSSALYSLSILYWYFGTEQGHAIRATGCNRQMARAQGINTDFHTVLALMISNGLVGLSGGLYAQYQGAADVNMGRGAIVIGLAAVIIGEVLFGKFRQQEKNLLLHLLWHL